MNQNTDNHKKKSERTRKTAYLGLLAALAILMGYVESLIPFDFGIPGVKLGLCNFVILITLMMYSWREALLISVIRVIVIGFLFGNMFSIAYGMAGALLSILVMSLLLKTDRFDVIGVSAAGGAAHNTGQIIVAYAVTPAFPVLWYMPVLMISGTITGIIIGIIAAVVWKRLPAHHLH